MILLDTNIVSEVFRPKPDAVVIAWLNAQEMNTLYLCTPVLAEMRFGAERLEESKRKNWLSSAIDRLEYDLYRDRILVFDKASALQYGRIAAVRQKAGKSLQLMDGLISCYCNCLWGEFGDAEWSGLHESQS